MSDARRTSDAISCYGGIDPRPSGVAIWQGAIKEIRTGRFKAQIQRVRQVLREQGPEAYREAKKSLPAVSFAGTFSYRKNKGIKDTTGFIVADLDHLLDVEEVFQGLVGDKNVWFAFRSPSGDGIKVGLRARGIQTDADHKRLFEATRTYFLDVYSIEIDSACKDICRLTFLSHDPDLWLNETPVFFDVERWTPKKEAPKVVPPPAFEQGQGKQKYAMCVLESSCQKIRESAPGQQHRMRRGMARLVGGYLHYGLEESTALVELERAVIDSGARNIPAAMKTVRGGLDHGKQDPCTIPDRPSTTVNTDTPSSEPAKEKKQEETRKSLFQDFDPSAYRAGNLLDGQLLPLVWLLANSLLAGTLGYFVGPPGAGKSQFLLQLCAAIATAEAAFIGGLWRIEKATRVLFICAEDDARILQRRLRQVLNKLRDLGLFSLSPARVEQLLRDNLFIVPASGEDLRLIRMDGANAGPSHTYYELLDAAKRIEGLGLVVIDPLSRFYGANENDNSTATLFSSLLERIAKDAGCTVICSHHTSKKAALVSGRFNLDAALDADAMRGASGLTGACRWQFNLTGLPVAFAKERLNLAGREGQFLAGKVSKKSYGPPEQAIYLERGKGGVLFPVQGTGRPQDVDAEAAILDWLRYRITKQAEEGLPGLTKRSAAECWKEVDAPGVTKTMFKEVTERAILDGELFLVMGKNTSGRRAEYLCLMPESDSEKTYQTGRKEAAEKRQQNEAAEAAEALPVLNVNDFNTLQSGSDLKRQMRQEDPGCTQVPEITEAAEAAEAAPLRGKEEHLKVPPPPSIPAGETIPKEVGNIARLSSTETPKPPLRRQTSTAMTTPKATAKTPSKFTPARETDSVPF